MPVLSEENHYASQWGFFLQGKGTKMLLKVWSTQKNEKKMKKKIMHFFSGVDTGDEQSL